MNVLVAFGTKYGSTAKVADAVASELIARGASVEVVDLRERIPTDLDRYDLVIVGSPVFIGKWTKPAQEFLRKNADALAKKKVALFACCSDILFEDKVEAARKMYLEDVAGSNGLEPVAMGLFGGEVDFAKYGMFTRFLLSRVGAKEEMEKKGMDISRPYDFRDWERIRKWARDLA